MANKPTIFLSYRRASSRELARFVHARLTALGADVFLDVETLNAVRFASVIEKEILQRDYFLILLKPDTLDPDSWVQREVQTALANHKPIVPLTADNFDFSQHVPPELAGLRDYGGIPYTDHYADEAIARIVEAVGLRKGSFSLPLVAGVGALIVIAALFIVFGLPVLAAGNTPSATETPTTSPTVLPTQLASTLGEECDVQPDPNDPNAYMRRAELRLVQEDYEAAVSDFTCAIQLEPDNAVAYFGRAEANNDSANYMDALDDYNRAIELDPEYTEAYNNRGQLYRNVLGRIEDSVDDYTMALLYNNPEPHFVYTNRGSAYYFLDEYEKALDDFEEAIRINPEYAYAYNGRGVTYSAMGELDQAIADLTTAIELEPQNAEHYANRGVIYRRNEQFDESIADYQHALEIDPSRFDIYANMGNLYFGLEHCPEALESYERYLELAGDRAEPHLARRVNELTVQCGDN